eukprot:Pgem_evm1s6400
MFNDLKACFWVSGKVCPSNDMKFDAIITRQAHATTTPWLQFRHDPFMFHQANLHPFVYQSKLQSLVSIWAEKSLQFLFKYINKLPVQSPNMDYISNQYRKRMEKDKCGLSAKIQVRKGVKIGLALIGSQMCEVDVTFVNNEIIQQNGQNLGLVQEIYGPDVTFTVPIKGGLQRIIKI